MHPKFADRIARRLTVVKRTPGEGLELVQELADRVMGYAPKDHPDYKQVLTSLAKYKGMGNVKDT